MALYTLPVMKGFSGNHWATRCSAGALALCMAVPASAQDAVMQGEPTPTPTPVAVNPAIPSDFSLPSSEEASPIVGPARPADAPAREISQPITAPTPRPTAAETTPAATQAIERGGVARPQAERPVRSEILPPVSTPASNVSSQPDAGAEQTSVANSATNAPPLGAEPAQMTPPNRAGASDAEISTAPSEGVVWWIYALGLLGVIGLALAIALYRRKSAAGSQDSKAATPTIDRPALGTQGTIPRPQVAPRPPPPEQAPPKIPPMPSPDGLVQSRIRAPSAPAAPVNAPRMPSPANGMVTTRVPSSGLVTANPQKVRRDAEKVQSKEKRSAPPRAAVRRNISFDW